MVLALAGCGAPNSTYFEAEPPTRVALPVEAGDPAYVGIQLLTVSEGDTVVLDHIDAEGLTSATQLEPLVADAAGEMHLIGIGTKADIVAGGTDLSLYKALPLAIGEGGPYQLAVVLTGEGTSHFDAIRLWFRVNDGDLTSEKFPLSATVCSAPTLDEALHACGPSP